MVKRLKCPECKAQIQAAHIHLEKALAKCDQCNAVFSFEEDIKESRIARRPEVFMPKGIEMLRLSSELSIEVSWRKNNSTSSFLTFFALFWNAIVFPFAAFAIISGNYTILLFLSLHLTVGIGLIYYLLSTYLNTSFIVVDDYRLTIEHRPLKMPFYPERNIETAEFKQLFVDKYVSSQTNGKNNYAYAVKAVLQNGEQLQLLKGIDKPEQALYIEQEIEQFLNIQDKAVDGEWEGLIR